VHSGGLETARLLNTGDPALEKPGAFGAVAKQVYMCIIGTLALERLVEMTEIEI
jgi:hypothetical protein